MVVRRGLGDSEELEAAERTINHRRLHRGGSSNASVSIGENRFRGRYAEGSLVQSIESANDARPLWRTTRAGRYG